VAHSCVICDNPAGAPHDVLVALRHSWATAPPRACLPGYVCVVARRHVIEPFELDDGGSWWAECMVVARALKAELGSRKFNYEIHGNTVPHLHLHLYPRFEGDPFVGRPIDGSSQRYERTADDLNRLRHAIESAVIA